MSLFWIILITAASVTIGTSICFWLLHQAHGVDTTVWILEHIVCPIIRIVVLLIVVSQVYPAIDENSTSLDFWRILSQQGQFQDLVNILFIVGLGLGFLPLVNHPVFALPLQSLFTIALVFHWQYQGLVTFQELIPTLGLTLKIIIYMLLAYFVTREVSVTTARWLDAKLAVSGSIRLVSDAIYLLLQIPVMLVYCSFLKQQLT